MERFDFNKAVKELLAGKKISGKDGVLAPLVKGLICLNILKQDFPTYIVFS